MRRSQNRPQLAPIVSAFLRRTKRPMSILTLFFALMAGIAATTRADVNLPAVFGDHMVLQRNTAVNIWGWDRAGQTITITANWDNAKPVTTTTNSRGRWAAQLPTPEAGGPYTIAITGSSARTLKDVLVGEVWLCSGQSNMEWPMNAINDKELEIAGAADYPTIRLFNVANTISLHQRADVHGSWSVCSPKTVGQFSAVGYLFGRNLSDELDVPIGLISSEVGGTRVEAWMSEEALGNFSHFNDELEYIAEMKDPSGRLDSTRNQQERWWTQLDKKSPVNKAWKSLAFDDADWSTMALPSVLSGDGMGNFDGLVYFRKVVEIPKAWDGQAGIIGLGPIDDYDDVWINGKPVGSTHADGQWAAVRNYEFAEGILQTGRNVITVRMLDTAGPGGIFGQPAQMYLTLQKEGFEERLSLTGDWQYQAGAKVGQLPAKPVGVGIHQNMASVLFNGMIAPIVPYSIQGAIWYQGESNRYDPALYKDLFAGLITDWRKQWGAGDFPFYFVQIAPYRYRGDQGETALLREAQAAALEQLVNTGMVVTLDIGNRNDIHPRNKQDVGKRLALQALAKTYGQTELLCDGPTVNNTFIRGSEAWVEFTNVGDGLLANGAELLGFMVAGRDQQFYFANARIEDHAVVATHPNVPRPVAVRYGFLPAPVANLANSADLPAAPFRTDNWSGPGHPIDNSLEAASHRSTDPGYTDLFNGKTLDGWVNVNCAPSTWRILDGMIHCSGFPTGVLRTEKQYENFILELEWRHLRPRGNAGLFVWSDPITAKGQPFTRSVEVQVMDGMSADWYTSDGDIFAIHGATMTPINSRGGNSRSFPTEYRANDSPLWNHYRVECVDGNIALAVNGKVVTTGKDISPRKGYICLESEGGPIDFRNIRIKELPASTPPLPANHIANVASGFRSLYNGVDFTGWDYSAEHQGHWKVANWTIDFDGQGPDLWSKESFGDFEMIADWRWSGPATEIERPIILASGEYQLDTEGKQVTAKVQEAGDSGIYLRGSSKSQINIWCWPIGSGEVYGYRTDANLSSEVRAGVTPSENADAPIGQWNRFHITMKGDRLTVRLNGKLVINNAQLPGVAATGPIALQTHGSPIQFANIYIRELE